MPRACASTNCSSSRRRRIGPAPKAPQQKASWFWFFRGVDNVLRADRAVFSQAHAAARDRRGGRLGERAPQRRGRPRRDFPGDGEQRDDVRRARLSRESSAARHRPQIGREAVGRCTRTRLIASRACRRSGIPALVCHALLEAGGEQAEATGQTRARLAGAEADSRCARRLDRAARPDVRPGGWAFQYANPHYPDVDDTAVVAMAMDRVQSKSAQGFRRRALRAPANGSSACRARTAPGARSMPTTSSIISTTFRSPITARLLDPPTEDVTARCVSMLAQLGETVDNSAPVQRAVDYLRRAQLPTAAGTAAGA